MLRYCIDICEVSFKFNPNTVCVCPAAVVGHLGLLEDTVLVDGQEVEDRGNQDRVSPVAGVEKWSTGPEVAAVAYGVGCRGTAVVEHCGNVEAEVHYGGSVAEEVQRAKERGEQVSCVVNHS